MKKLWFSVKCDSVLGMFLFRSLGSDQRDGRGIYKMMAGVSVIGWLHLLALILTILESFVRC